jgi:hypothetical protein
MKICFVIVTAVALGMGTGGPAQVAGGPVQAVKVIVYVVEGVEKVCEGVMLVEVSLTPEAGSPKSQK